MSLPSASREDKEGAGLRPKLELVKKAVIVRNHKKLRKALSVLESNPDSTDPGSAEKRPYRDKAA